MPVACSLLVKDGQLIRHKVFLLNPHPYVFPKNTLFNLVQRFSRKHLVDINIVAEPCEKDILELGVQNGDSVKKNTGIPSYIELIVLRGYHIALLGLAQLWPPAKVQWPPPLCGVGTFQ